MAVLALLGQIALGSAVPAQATPWVPDLLASPFGDIPICHSGIPGIPDDGAPAGHAHHGMQCALCPACHALATAAVLPVPASAVPAPQAMLAARQALPPPARGPPAAAVLAAVGSPATNPWGMMHKEKRVVPEGTTEVLGGNVLRKLLRGVTDANSACDSPTCSRREFAEVGSENTYYL